MLSRREQITAKQKTTAASNYSSTLTTVKILQQRFTTGYTKQQVPAMVTELKRQLATDNSTETTSTSDFLFFFFNRKRV